MLRARGDVETTRDAASRAVEALSRSSAGTEVSTAQTLWAWAHAHAGEWDEAEQLLAESLRMAVPGTRFESLVECAEIIGTYDDPVRAAQMLDEADLVGAPDISLASFQKRLAGEQLSRFGRSSEAIEVLSSIASDRATRYPGFHVQRLLALLNAHLLDSGIIDVTVWNALEVLARRQGAYSALLEASLLRGLSETPGEASAVIDALSQRDRALLSVRAEAVLRRIGDLSEEAIDVVLARPRRAPVLGEVLGPPDVLEAHLPEARVVGARDGDDDLRAALAQLPPEQERDLVEAAHDVGHDDQEPLRHARLAPPWDLAAAATSWKTRSICER